MTFVRRICVAIVLAGSSGLVGCSASNDLGAGTPESVVGDDVHTVEADTVAAAVEEGSSTSVAASGEEAPVDAAETSTSGDVEGEIPASAEPLRPAGEPPATTPSTTTSTNAYISRRSMTAQVIEVHWSTTEGVAEYHIHRVPRTTDDEPPVTSMTIENRVHVADDGGRFADEEVVAGKQYWHGVREFSADGQLLAHGWHRTVAIDDLEPPSTVGGLTAVLDNGEVLVTWEQPDENYQLHSYRVLRGVDGEPPESIAVTWRLDQRSFIDDQPPMSADVVYEVVATDFHWNKSEPGRITVDLS